MPEQEYYKVLGNKGECWHGGKGKWSLPRGNKPGKWMPRIEHLEPCVSGYHVLTRDQLIQWLGPTIWRVEVRGKILEQDNKCVVQQARLLYRLETWNERTARLFACDCAEDALPFFEKKYPQDTRPREAIETARRFARAEATTAELDAAKAAAFAAAWDAAVIAAKDAAEAASGVAAGVATRAVELAAAWSVWAVGDVGVTAWDAQTQRLWRYLETPQK